MWNKVAYAPPHPFPSSRRSRSALNISTRRTSVFHLASSTIQMESHDIGPLFTLSCRVTCLSTYSGEADEPDSPTLGLGDLPPVSVMESTHIPHTPPKPKRTVPKRYDPYADPAAKQQRRRAQTLDDANVQDPSQESAPASSTPTGYDATAYFPAYGAVGGYYPVPMSTGYFPPPTAPTYPPPPTSDAHPAYPQPQMFYPQPPGYGQPAGPNTYYPQFGGAWRAGTAGDKPAEEEHEQEPKTGDGDAPEGR